MTSAFSAGVRVGHCGEQSAGRSTCTCRWAEGPGGLSSLVRAQPGCEVETHVGTSGRYRAGCVGSEARVCSWNSIPACKPCSVEHDTRHSSGAGGTAAAPGSPPSWHQGPQTLLSVSSLCGEQSRRDLEARGYLGPSWRVGGTWCSREHPAAMRVPGAGWRYVQRRGQLLSGSPPQPIGDMGFSRGVRRGMWAVGKPRSLKNNY